MYVVYVSGALSAPTEAQCHKNARRIARKALDLTEQGFACIVPGWDCFFSKKLDWSAWLRADVELLSRADIVYALPELKVRPSRGRAREIREARKRSIPVVYSDTELHAVARLIRKQGAVA